MKRAVMTIVMVSLVGLGPLFGISKAKLVQWNGIITEKDPGVKLQKLEEFQKEYGDDKDTLTMRLYTNLTDTAYKLQQYDKAIQYGEKSLTFKDLDTSDKLQIFLELSNAYYVTKQDIEKAFNLAGSVIDLAKASTDLPMQPDIKNALYVAPSLRIQVKILYAKEKDAAAAKLALDKAVEAYTLDKSETSLKLILAVGSRVHAAGGADEVCSQYERAFTARPDDDLARLLGVMYSKKGNNEKAVEYMKASYKIKKSAEVGYNLGILLNKTDLDAAIGYLADAFVLNDPKLSAKAEELLKHLYFNVKAKDMIQEEQDKGYEEILAGAHARVGK